MLGVNSAILDENDQLIAKAKYEGRDGANATFSLASPVDPTHVKKGEKLHIRLFDTINGLETYQGNSDRLDGNRLYVSAFKVETFIERRDDVKVVINKPAFLVARDDATNRMQKVSVRLRDISAGGVCIVTDYELMFDKEYEMIFDLGKEADVLTIGLVRKTIGVHGKYEYGCRFLNLHPSQESLVREYVFKKLVGLSR